MTTDEQYASVRYLVDDVDAAINFYTTHLGFRVNTSRGQSPCDAGPRELRLDVICPGTLAAASRRNDGSGCVAVDAECPERSAITSWGIAPRCRSGTAHRAKLMR
jgi:catechol 2,3-dioxygenase-like lactoylglutathione lyase family enzyme